jgi:thioester reductase-like protein
MTNIHFVTGGTGFVGTGIVLELLKQTDAEIVCLVRPGAESADTRLHRALIKAGQLYDYDPALLATVRERCRAVPGDVNSELCGVAPQSLPRISQFWHCAALLHYEERYEAEVFQTNVGGTHHAVALAHRLGVENAFNHVSTAYIAGTRSGLILEEPAEIRPTNNLYEQSKIRAEQIISGIKDFRTRIFRPSGVIGHGTTYAVSGGFSGLYIFMRKLLQFKMVMARMGAGQWAQEPMRMLAFAEAPLNFIPVDLVTRQAVRISTSASPASIFHLTNATPPTVAEVLSLMFLQLGLRAPIFTTTKDEFNWIDRKFDEGIAYYQAHITSYKHFDRSHTDAALGQSYEGVYKLSPKKLYAFYQWYIDLLTLQRPRLVAARQKPEPVLAGI